MQLLGIIILVTGVILILAGKSVSGNLPSSNQADKDEDFLQLLQSVRRLVAGAGTFLMVIGGICILIGLMG